MFNLTLPKSKLLLPLLTVAAAADRKQSLPILTHVLLDLGADRLLITATDLEIEITAYIPCEASDSSGKITVPAKKIVDIIRSLEEDTTPSLSLKADILVIKAGRSQFKLSTLPAASFPTAVSDLSELEFAVSREAFTRLLQATHFAMSQNDTRVSLNGLLLEFDTNWITAVATDGHRMAVCKLACDAIKSHHRFLLPRKGVQEILKLLNTLSDEQISIAAGKNHFKLSSAEYTFQSRLIEARFPPYVKVISQVHDKFVLIDRDILRRALGRIVILAHEKSRAVLLHLQGSALTLVANNQEKEEAIETLEAQIDGHDLKIGINAGYLLDVLNFVNEGLVRLSMSTTNASILVESLQDEHYQYIIMPMTL